MDPGGALEAGAGTPVFRAEEGGTNGAPEEGGTGGAPEYWAEEGVTDAATVDVVDGMMPSNWCN